MLSGLGNSESCFLSGIRAFFIEHRGYDDLRCATEGGHNAAAYLYAILIYKYNGGATADDIAKEYMRRVAGDVQCTFRSLSDVYMPYFVLCKYNIQIIFVLHNH
jgi:hypothetical protein